MVSSHEHHGMQEARIMLGLLESVERDGAQSQRRLASELGVALGLVNAYLKRCVMKGLMKVGQAPARRYAYYLTPQGFAEKARLTVDYFSYSFAFFRRARSEYTELFALAVSRGFSRLALAGASDLAEIATICALDSGVEIAAVVDKSCTRSRSVGVPVFGSFDDVTVGFDAVVITALQDASEVWCDVRARYGSERIFVPPLLGLAEQARPSEHAG